MGDQPGGESDVLADRRRKLEALRAAGVQPFPYRYGGVEPIAAVGQPFDPHRHEALGHQDSEEHPEGHVISQTRKGYKLKDRLLRPASVFVARTPGKKD